MKQSEMLEVLTEKATRLRDELLTLEREFNQKKEEYLKVQGALEAITELED
jgi:hypothetical protein